MCLLGLREVNKYWRVNVRVLDFFEHYLEDAPSQTSETAQRRTSQEPATAQPTNGHISEGMRPEEPSVEMGDGNTLSEFFSEEYFHLLYGPWAGGEGLGEFQGTPWASNPMQMEDLHFLERSL